VVYILRRWWIECTAKCQQQHRRLHVHAESLNESYGRGIDHPRDDSLRQWRRELTRRVSRIAVICGVDHVFPGRKCRSLELRLLMAINKLKRTRRLGLSVNAERDGTSRHATPGARRYRCGEGDHVTNIRRTLRRGECDP